MGGFNMETLRSRLLELALEMRDKPFKYNDLDEYTQKELMWLAFDDYSGEDLFDNWEYLEGFDMYHFMRSVLRGYDSKVSLFDLYHHTKQYLIKYIDKKIEEIIP